MATSSLSVNNKNLGQLKLGLTGFIFALGILLLALVDIRRGFMFTNIQGFGEYFSTSPYHVLSWIHIIMLLFSVSTMAFLYQHLKNLEGSLTHGDMEKYVKITAFVIFGLLVADIFV